MLNSASCVVEKSENSSERKKKCTMKNKKIKVYGEKCKML